MNIKKMQKYLDNKYDKKIKIKKVGKKIILTGELDCWDDIVTACRKCVVKEKGVHVVNKIRFTGYKDDIKKPSVQDNFIDGKRPDVLIIGGGISGTTIARELSKYDISVLLVDKENDVAMHASSRNDGEVHCGLDLSKGSIKQSYVVRGNLMFDKLCKDLDVPFKRCGQYVAIEKLRYFPLVLIVVLIRKYLCGIKDTKIISRRFLLKKEPNIAKEFKYAIYNKSAGRTSPYNLVIATAENAVTNGVKLSLNTMVMDMEIENGKIKKVITNRGNVFPKVVINAAGVFAEDISIMAKDHFYSIHPRKGTIIILDKKSNKLANNILSYKNLDKVSKYTKGGAIIHSVSDNLLVGPDAIEVPDKEDFSTSKESIENIFNKHSKTIKDLDKKYIITYFSGIRAATFEEDYVIENGRKTKNIIHVAGIQSPGLTTAPAVAQDVSKMALKLLLRFGNKVKRNDKFNPIRKAPPKLSKMKHSERMEYIRNNPDYGEIVCRCEEISKGEILDALRSPIKVPTIDAIKRRVRPGMGRCQGGFCMPLVEKIISDEFHIPIEEVKKSSVDSYISFGKTK